MLSCKPAAHFLFSQNSVESCSAVLTLYIKSELKKEDINILIYGCKQLVNKVFMWMQYHKQPKAASFVSFRFPHAVAKRHLVLAGGRRNICFRRTTYAFRSKPVKPVVTRTALLCCYTVQILAGHTSNV